VSFLESTHYDLHQTVADNSPNKLQDPTPPGHQTSPFANQAAYDASPGMTDANRTYYLGDDDPGTTESFQLEFRKVSAPFSIPAFVVIDSNGTDGANATYLSFRSTRLADTAPPAFSLTPPPGTYIGEQYVRVRINEPG